MPEPLQRLTEKAYDMLTREDDGRLCRDIPDDACHEQPRNFALHVASLGLTKTSDGLIDPKLILSWALNTVGAAPFLVGLLVPVREAGALLPQLFIAEWVRQKPVRKWIWALGSLVQGLSVIGIVLSLSFLQGNLSGIGVIVCLALLAVARSFCSVSYKDVLGKTVSKSTRGTATGTASSVASAGIILFGVLLTFSIVPLTLFNISVVLMIAAGLWILAATLFTQLKEIPGATEGGKNGISGFTERLKQVLSDDQLIRFICVRALLISTALAPPYLVLASDSDAFNLNIDIGNANSIDLTQLGLFLMASSLAGFFSSYLWGRLADQSSRKVLLRSALIAAAGLGIAAVLQWKFTNIAQNGWVLPLLLFVVMLAYQGVRLGRSTHLVDMADTEQRASYTAVSNTVIGVCLLFGGGFGIIANSFGVIIVLLVFSLMCTLAFILGLKLEEVQKSD